MDHLDAQLAEVRDLTAKSRRTGPRSFHAFRDLVSFLLHQTIAKSNAVIAMDEKNLTPHEVFIGGTPEIKNPLPINNGHYLRVTLDLQLHKDRLRVRESSCQYQLDQEGSAWIFRYDFLRHPSSTNPYPPSHLQINANLREAKRTMKDCPKIHFPTGRASLESVIRFLAVEFGIRCRDKHWEKILAESERLFV